MDTIEKILANAKPSIIKSDKYMVYYWEGRLGLRTRDMDRMHYLVHYISNDRWEGYRTLTAFGEMSSFSSKEIKFVRNHLGL